MSFDSFWEKIKKLIGQIDLVLHFRIATNNVVNKEQTHPFKLNNVKELEDTTTEQVIFMNGSISNQLIYENMNDAQSYIVEHQQAFNVINNDVLNLIQSDTGCKWCVVTPEDIMLSNGFIKSNGKYYSNLKHKEEYLTYNPDLVDRRITSVSSIVDKELIQKIIENTDLYEGIKYFVQTRCQYQDSCSWCLEHCLSNLETLEEIKKFYMNYVSKDATGNIVW